MKMVRSLLLGAAAGLVATAGAQAAGLPVKAKAVQYVKICSLYGAGFYYMPGSDICLKVGGAIRYEYNFNSPGSFATYKNGTNAHFNRFENWLGNRARAYLTLDSRQQTAYGTLRTYTALHWSITNHAAGNGATGGASLYRGFIQFAGFTFGRTVSFFDFYVTPRYSNQTNIIGSDTGGAGMNVAAYTAQFGNGVSASISLEDTAERQVALHNFGAANFNYASSGVNNSYRGIVMKDVVANVRIDQAWGSAAVMGALHLVNATYYGATENTGHPSDVWGWAFGAGIHLNVPTGPRDTFTIQGNWTKGATRYAGQGFNTGVAMYDGSTVAIGHATDGIYIFPGGIELTEAWSFYAGYQHYWVPNLRTSLYGGYFHVNYDGTATAIICAVAPLATGVCDPDFSFWQIGSRTVWSIVRGLDLSVDIMYNKAETANGGATAALAPGGGKPATTYTFGDVDSVQGIFRIQRDFN